MMGAAFHYRDQRPHALVAALAKPPSSREIDELRRSVLICLDALKDGHGNNAIVNRMLEVLAVAQILLAQHGNKALQDLGRRGYAAMVTASARPQQPLKLTTPEYRVIRPVVLEYLKSAQVINAQKLVEAHKAAVRRLAT